MHHEDEHALRALRSGAAGFMSKDSAPERLTGAIRQIAAGSKYITPATAARLAGYLGSNAGKPLHESLSEREHDVLRKITSGQTPSQIADDLFLSPNTISTYRARLLEKLNLRTTADLVRYAITHRLID